MIQPDIHFRRAISVSQISYYGLHQYFLTERAVYVIVSNATRFAGLRGKDLDQVRVVFQSHIFRQSQSSGVLCLAKKLKTKTHTQEIDLRNRFLVALVVRPCRRSTPPPFLCSTCLRFTSISPPSVKKSKICVRSRSFEQCSAGPSR